MTLVHRRNEFRGALDSVEKVQAFKNSGKIKLITPGEVAKLHGEKDLTAVDIKTDESLIKHQCDAFIPLFDWRQSSG